MEPYGGFEHNAHALRLVTRLERRYARWDGLNLCYETLEGLVKHNGPLLRPDGEMANPLRKIHCEIIEFDAVFPLNLKLYASAEAQCAALADDIAYNAHDLDDGLRACLFTLDDLREVAFLRGLLEEVERLYPGLERVRVIHELVRRVITRFVNDVFEESQVRLAALGPDSIDDIRHAGHAVVAFSKQFALAQMDIKDFLFTRMYRHRAILPVWRDAGRIVRGLFDFFMRQPGVMAAEWAEAASGVDEPARARLVADYIAGMTDRYALARAEKWLEPEAEAGRALIAPWK
jgi:dGTPase